MQNQRIKSAPLNFLNPSLTFTNQVKLYVPTMTGTQVNKKSENVRKEILSKFAETFGGANEQPINGAWMSDRDGLVVEQNYVISAFSSDVIDETFVNLLASKVMNDLEQEAVLYEINGKGFLIENSNLA